MNQVKNSITLIGRLGGDPEIRELAADKRLARFSLATSENYRNAQGEWVKSTQWHRCVAWGKLGERIHKLLAKGKQVAIQGKLTYHEYTPAEGPARKQADIVVTDFTLLDAKPQPAA